jgi:hypothetical protein
MTIDEHTQNAASHTDEVFAKVYKRELRLTTTAAAATSTTSSKVICLWPVA